jgi:hypothetical protein
MVTSTCGICKAEAGNLMHALIECSHAKLLWTAAKEILLVKLPRLHPSTWARDILCGSLFPDKEIAIIILVMYSIWMLRNNVTHGEAVYEPIKFMEFIRETLHTLELPKVQVQSKPARPACTWHGPPANTIKIISDGALQAKPGMTATGIVVRDATAFRGARCMSYSGISEPLTIEALELRDAFKYAMEQGFGQVMFEVDCAELVKFWHRRLEETISYSSNS